MGKESFFIMFRGDFYYLVLPLLIAFYQVRFIWGKLPDTNERDTEVPGSYNRLDKLRIYYLFCLAFLIFILQLSFAFLPISQTSLIVWILRFVGYLLIGVGFCLSLVALKTLGENWTGMPDYRIKRGQRLVTTGAYRLVRHPIYLSALLEVLGFELVANSWLFLPFMVIGFFIVYRHALLEERLLAQKFKEEFISYQKRVKMLIPFLF